MDFNVNFNRIDIANKEFMTSGAVNIFEAHFEFDESWNGYARTAVFRSGDYGAAVAVVLDATDTCMVPWESLIAEAPLWVGVVGVNGDKKLPTNYVNAGCVAEGAEGGDFAPPPTPSEIEQILAQIGDLRELKTKAKDTLVDAINETYDRAGTGGVEIDPTLSVEGAAADAAAVGDALGKLGDVNPTYHETFDVDWVLEMPVGAVAGVGAAGTMSTNTAGPNSSTPNHIGDVAYPLFIQCVSHDSKLNNSSKTAHSFKLFDTSSFEHTLILNTEPERINATENLYYRCSVTADSTRDVYDYDSIEYVPRLFYFLNADAGLYYLYDGRQARTTLKNAAGETYDLQGLIYKSGGGSTGRELTLYDYRNLAIVRIKNGWTAETQEYSVESFNALQDLVEAATLNDRLSIINDQFTQAVIHGSMLQGGEAVTVTQDVASNEADYSYTKCSGNTPMPTELIGGSISGSGNYNHGWMLTTAWTITQSRIESSYVSKTKDIIPCFVHYSDSAYGVYAPGIPTHYVGDDISAEVPAIIIANAATSVDLHAKFGSYNNPFVVELSEPGIYFLTVRAGTSFVRGYVTKLTYNEGQTIPSKYLGSSGSDIIMLNATSNGDNTATVSMSWADIKAAYDDGKVIQVNADSLIATVVSANDTTILASGQTVINSMWVHARFAILPSDSGVSYIRIEDTAVAPFDSVSEQRLYGQILGSMLTTDVASDSDQWMLEDAIDTLGTNYTGYVKIIDGVVPYQALIGAYISIRNNSTITPFQLNSQLSYYEDRTEDGFWNQEVSDDAGSMPYVIRITNNDILQAPLVVAHSASYRPGISSPGVWVYVDYSTNDAGKITYNSWSVTEVSWPSNPKIPSYFLPDSTAADNTLCVTITGDGTDDSPYVASHNAAEIKAAGDSGKAVYALFATGTNTENALNRIMYWFAGVRQEYRTNQTALFCTSAASMYTLNGVRNYGRRLLELSVSDDKSVFFSEFSIDRSFTGATATDRGESGVVPGPPPGYQNKFLRGDATWADPPTDYSLGLSNATVGQIAKITAVDESGAPTAWEAVDIKSDDLATWVNEKIDAKLGVIENGAY